jgi:hypothetical protein
LLDYIWLTYDKDKDNTISKEEAKGFIEGYLGVYSPTEQEFNTKYNQIDIDGDGVIS